MAQHRPLDPAITRIVEALADLMVDRDIVRLRTASPTHAAPRATGTIEYR